MSEDRNSMGFWFPKIQAAGLPVPTTHLVHTDADLACLLDGVTPAGYDTLVAQLGAAGDDVGWPCFLRTGHGSGKHQWIDTCHVPVPSSLPMHIFSLVEWSHLVDMMGLPTDVWAVRELLETQPLFRCQAYGGMPVTREFRLFVADDTLDHVQPYWPADAVKQGEPDNPHWPVLLAAANELQPGELDTLLALASAAVLAVGGGYWSVDLLQDRHGGWWLTDMALGEHSFRYEP